MRRALLVALLALAFVPQAQAEPAFGCPLELQGDYPEPRVCLDTQTWWMQGAPNGAPPPANFAPDSTHAHMMVPFQLGERFVFPAAGEGYEYRYFTQLHNDVGGSVRGVRGGGFQLGCDGTIYDPSAPRKITEVDQSFTGTLRFSACTVNKWRVVTGTLENRFTTDTTSRFGQRQYNSDSWRAQFNTAGVPVGLRFRSWYQGIDYGDIYIDTKLRASTLATSGLPSTIAYHLGSGAKWASAYIDPALHCACEAAKGRVLFENRAGTSGTIAIPSDLAPGLHFLLVVGIEPASNGWQAAVGRIPFNVEAQ